MVCADDILELRKLSVHATFYVDIVTAIIRICGLCLQFVMEGGVGRGEHVVFARDP